jgi:hypothetical protein
MGSKSYETSQVISFTLPTSSPKCFDGRGCEPDVNREKMKQPAAVGIDGSWNHRRNGSAHILDMVDV